ncbi:MAG: WecB/TagA/CpsF family glycosyltransferase [Bacteroidales bacterium]|nr:WecB/TagA/CpsF family glycosyltransferase [Bacteroidales bacterium]
MLDFFGYKLTESLSELPMDGEAVVVSCLNPHSFVKALDDAEFHKALEQSDVLLPDGEGICMALKLLRGERIDKIAGDDLHGYLLERLSEKGGKVYYMGSTERVLSLIEKRLGREHPGVTVRCFSPSFCDELSYAESMQIVDDINAFAPDVLFVSMTAPKQEKWVEKYRVQLSGVKVIASIGAVFDFYAGTVKRAPRWAVRMHLEWLFRLVKEPRRMWERNFVSTPRYLRWVWKHRNELR